MGVHGLTTYLRENQRVLGKTVQLPPAHVSDDVIITIVVDGWSFIYQLYEQSRLPWVYGGEYKAFSQCVEQVVKAWVAIGLEVYFVFDGSAPELKIPTLISRLNRTNIERSLLFFRTSPTSRSTSRFLHENRILPPLVHLSCVVTLQKLARETSALEVHFADEEGDPYAVELAGRLGAYVVGNDSDFVILNSGRYAGYISLDEMLWTVPLPVDEPTSANRGEDGGFLTVVKSKTKKRSAAAQQRTARGLIPPENTPTMDLTLSVTVYTPSALASHLKIPVTLLPLLASLVGNDFSNHSSTQRNVQSLFFERDLTLSRRITHAASTLSTILNASTQRRKARHQVGSVMDLIDRTVHALLVRSPSTLSLGEVDATVDRIVNAALQYAIDKYEGGLYGPASLWPTKICALHGDDTCPLLAIFSRALSQSQEPANVSPEDSVMLKLRTMYLEAFRSGKLQPKLTDVLSTATFWPRIFLENPDTENVARSIGRPIRRWIYALLEDAVGLPEAPEEELCTDDGSVTQEGENEEDPDELIDVIEDDSPDDEDTDFLAPLRGELRRLHVAEDSSETTTPASSRSRSRPPPRPKCVIEYVRRGSRIAPEEVPVPDLAALIISSGSKGNVDLEAWVPVQLRSLEERMALFLQILESNVPAVRAIPSDRLMAVLVLRWVVRTLHVRALESGMSKEREREKWTRQEARTFLAFYMASLTRDHMAERSDNSDANVPITDRNIQLVAQVLVAIETIQLLSQVLLLSEQVPTNVEALSGVEFHSYLTEFAPVAGDELPQGLWDAFMINHRTAPPRHLSAHVDIVTYRFNGEMMYVPVAQDYPEALAHVRAAFPQLKKLKDSSITLSLNVITGDHRQSVGITAAAWPKMISHLSRYEVIDIHTIPSIPDITITTPDESEAAPPYRGLDDTMCDEKASSRPTYSRSQSRPPSPAPRLSPMWLFQKLNGSLDR
ncbi:PIN domain-like protein [Gyrodon lividus]|nr:PIN domain-like protein [Gyrodon lividus]